MNCLICRTEFTNNEIIRDHYISEYLVDATNDVFRELFTPDIVEKSCHICGLEFDTCRMKKNRTFLLHYNQAGGSRLIQHPINIVQYQKICTLQ